MQVLLGADGLSAHINPFPVLLSLPSTAQQFPSLARLVLAGEPGGPHASNPSPPFSNLDPALPHYLFMPNTWFRAPAFDSALWESRSLLAQPSTPTTPWWVSQLCSRTPQQHSHCLELPGQPSKFLLFVLICLCLCLFTGITHIHLPDSFLPFLFPHERHPLL